MCTKFDPSSRSGDGLNLFLSPAASADALRFLGHGPHLSCSKTEHILQCNMFGRGGKKIITFGPSFLEMFEKVNFYQRKKKNPTPNSKQETLISMPGSSIALWKCYPTVIATFSSCL